MDSNSLDPASLHEDQVLKLFIEHSPAAIAMFDKNMRYIAASRRFLIDYELGERDITGMSHYDVFPEIQESWKEVHQRCLAGATERAEEDPFPRANGQLDWICWEIRPWYHQPGVVGGIILFSEVITDRKQNLEALRESEEKYRSIYENSSVAILLSTPEGHILSANEYACSIFARSEEELREVGRAGIIDSDDPVLPLFLKERMETGRASGELTLIRKDGTRFPAEVSSVIFTDQNGKEKTSIVIRDISSSKKSETESKTLNRRLEQLLQTIQDLSVASDLDTIMRIVRTAARKLAEADGSTFVLREEDHCFYADEDSSNPLWKGQRFPMTSCISGWSMLNRQALYIEDIYEDPRIPIEVYRKTFVKGLAMVPIRIQDPIGAIGVYWAHPNIPAETEMRLLQTLADAAARAIENVQLIENLEKMVNQRTAQLQATNVELESFSYSISHDLRAPLRAIYGFSQILASRHRQSLNDEGKQYMDYIVQSGMRMENLINDLLKYSRLGRKSLDIKPINLTGIIESVISDCQILLQEAGGQITVTGDSPQWMGDQTLLHQVLINLIDNAIKYRRDDERLQIGVAIHDNANDLIINISDNGIGIKEEYCEKIFNVFQRLHTEEKYPGTGIGLATVKKAITLLEGTISVSSRPGSGSTFTLTFPKVNPVNHFSNSINQSN